MSHAVVRRTVLPVLFLILAVGVYVLYSVQIEARLSSELHVVLRKILKSVLVISIAFIAQRVTGAIFNWYRDTIAVRTATQLDDELIPLLRRVTTIAVWVIAFLVILPLYGVNISALITALGVTSLAIALAAQDTIANIIAGFLIMIDRPFRLDDRIKLPTGETVVAIDIGVRRSKFLAEDNSIVIIPNLDLSKSKIVNYTYGEERQRGIQPSES
jgi:small-conductance mechanosensitive channel